MVLRGKILIDSYTCDSAVELKTQTNCSSLTC